jgi:hypothetical protein
MNKNNVIEPEDRDENQDPLMDMLRSGAQQLIHQAVEAELQSPLEEHAESRTSSGTVAVVRNGHLLFSLHSLIHLILKIVKPVR